MNDRNIRKQATFGRVLQFMIDNPLDPPNAAATAEINALTAVNSALTEAALAQDSGRGTASGAVLARRAKIAELRALMSSLAEAARSLDKNTYPDVATKMRMSGARSIAQLLVRAELFAETLEPIAQVFIDLGAPEDVMEELEGLIAAVKAAGNLKLTGVDTRAGGTLNIEAKAREGMRHVAKLSCIMTQIYRKDPVKLAQWRMARRVTPYTHAQPPAPQPEPEPGGGGS